MLQTRSSYLLVAQVNTVAGGSIVSISNSAGWVVNASSTILNSAGWVIAQSNTGGTVILNGGSTSIINTAGWIVAISNTSGIKTFATLETAQMSSNGVALTAGYAIIAGSGTDNTIVAAVATKKIRVLSYHIMSLVGNNIRFQSGTGASNLLTGFSYIGSNGGLVAPYNPMGWFETSGNNLLNIKMTAAQSIGGCLTYLEI